MILLAVVIGIVAGLRTVMAPFAIALAAAAGRLDLAGSPLGFLGGIHALWFVALLAIGELVGDKLPGTPSRKTLPQFLARLTSGGTCGTAVGAGVGVGVSALWLGFGLGLLGAVLGTFAGAAARAALAARFGRDRPAALIEDSIAIAGAGLVFAALGLG